MFHVAGVRRDGHPLVVGVRPCGDEVEVAAWARARTTLLEQFDAGDVVGAAASIGQAFAGVLVDLSALRAHDGAGVVARLLAEPLAAADAALADVYTRDAGLMRWLVSVGLPVPPAFRAAAEHTLRRRMLRRWRPSRRSSRPCAGSSTRRGRSCSTRRARASSRRWRGRRGSITSG